MTITSNKFYLLDWYKKEIGWDSARLNFTISLTGKAQYCFQCNQLSIMIKFTERCIASGVNDTKSVYASGVNDTKSVYIETVIELLRNIEYFETRKGHAEFTNYLLIKYPNDYQSILLDLQYISKQLKPLKQLVERIKRHDDHIIIRR